MTASRMRAWMLHCDLQVRWTVNDPSVVQYLRTRLCQEPYQIGLSNIWPNRRWDPAGQSEENKGRTCLELGLYKSLKIALLSGVQLNVIRADDVRFFDQFSIPQENDNYIRRNRMKHIVLSISWAILYVVIPDSMLLSLNLVLEVLQ